MSSSLRPHLLSVPLSLLCWTSALWLAAPAIAQTQNDIAVSASPQAKSSQSKKSVSIEALVAQVENQKLPIPKRLAAIQAIGQFGPEAFTAVTVLRSSLNERNNTKIRLLATEALTAIGSKAKDASPELETLLKDPNDAVRAAAAKAFSKLEDDNPKVVLSLRELVGDRNPMVRVNAIEAIATFGKNAQPAVPALAETLRDPNKAVKNASIQALGQLGPDAKLAVQDLSKLLSDSDSQTSMQVLLALSRIGSEASLAVPELQKAMESEDLQIQTFAIMTLGRIGNAAEPAVPMIHRALKDSKKDIRQNAATALGNIDVAAKDSIPKLVEVINDDDAGVRIVSINSINRLVGYVHDNVDKFSRDDLTAVIETLEKALPLLEDPRNNVNEEARLGLRRSFLAIKQAKDSRYLDTTVDWVQENPAIALIIFYILATPGFWLFILLIRPLWLLKINDILKPYTDFELPTPLGTPIRVPLRFVMFLGFLHYHPRVLDSWVERQLNIARDAFAHKSTVNDRRVYIPIPVVMQGNTVTAIGNADLQSTFLDGRQCVLIWGEGGIGKTSLACQMAQWSMSEDRNKRLCRHRMIPVLIEQELDFRVPDGKDPFREAIRGQLQALVDSSEPLSDDFIEKLLRQRRVLVIVDRLSELSDATRQEIRPGHPDFPANALIVTSRVEENLDNVPKTLVRPMRIEGNRLSSFLEAYLNQCNKRELFTDSEYFDACSQLSKMVGQRNITVLLAKLYAEQLIAHKEGIADHYLPDNIPDLMLSYLNELNRDHNPGEPDNPTVHQDAKVLAWECLKHSFRPGPVRREMVLAEMELACGIDHETAKNRLRHLENRLRILQVVGPAQDQISFSLDPLAECLAALYLVELYGNESYLWQDFLFQADNMPGAPESIQGFLLALRDCCMTRGVEMDIPETVVDELGRRVGLSTEMLRRAQIEQRLSRLAPKLTDGIAETRLRAIRELGELGAAAKPVLPALGREMHDPDWRIRQEVIRSIGLMGAEARNAIPLLVERMRDEDRRVACEAIAALGKIGVIAIPALLTALESPVPYVRSSAAWVLANFEDGAKNAVPALTKLLQDEDWQVRLTAVYALGAIGEASKSAIPELVSTLRGEYVLVRQEASRALWRIKGVEASQIVTSLVR